MSTPSVLLSQDLAASLAGINIKWAYTGLSAIKEVSLVYFKNVADTTIVSKDIASGVMRYNINSGFDSGSPYSFQLQVSDLSGNSVFSNTLLLQAPYFMVPPVWISGPPGVDPMTSPIGLAAFLLFSPF